MNTAAIDALYGVAAPRGVRWSGAATRYNASIVPSESDSLDEIVVKAREWSKIIEAGGSLAAAFGKLDGTDSGRDWQAVAENNMTAREAKMWGIWKTHKKMPPINKDANRATVPPKIAEGLGQEKKALDSAKYTLQALRNLYGGIDLEFANLYWFKKNYESFIPLLCAAEKVLLARRGASGGTEQDPREFQEMLACRWAMAVANNVKQRDTLAMHRRTKALAVALESVHTRKVAVTANRKVGKEPKDITGQTDAVLGITPVGKPRHYDAKAGAGRLQRSGDFGMGALSMAQGTKRKASSAWPTGSFPPSAKNPYGSTPGAGPSRLRSPSPQQQLPEEDDEMGEEEGQVTGHEDIGLFAA